MLTERIFFDKFKETTDYVIENDPILQTVTQLLTSHADAVRERNDTREKVTSKMLSLARDYHPEHLCHKDSYAAAHLNIGEWGSIVLVARNGLPHATPSHLHEYSTSELEKRVQTVSETSKKNKRAKTRLGWTLSKLKREGVEVSSCSPFMTETGTCFKLFDANTHQFSDRGEDNCPSQLAGCAEQILIHWEKYAISLFKTLLEKNNVEQNIIITNVIFPLHGGDPVVNYYTGDGNAYTSRVHPDLSDGVIKPVGRTMFTSTLPCPNCTEVICQSVKKDGIPTEVHLQTLSRHGRKGNTLDLDDLQGLLTLAGNGVKVCSAQMMDDPTMSFKYHQR